jgi:hypothetical protein
MNVRILLRSTASSHWQAALPPDVRKVSDFPPWSFYISENPEELRLPSPRWGEGKVNTRVNSLAPIGGEGGQRPGEGATGEHSEFFHTFPLSSQQPDQSLQDQGQIEGERGLMKIILRQLDFVR